MNPDSNNNFQNPNNSNPAGFVNNQPQADNPNPSAPNYSKVATYSSMQNNQPAATVPVRTNPNSTQNTLLISEIRDGIVIMNDGSFRSVIMVKSINFDLMSPQERERWSFLIRDF